jgi:hypothetical protein
MPGNLHQISYMVRRDPIAVAGFLLIGTAGFLFIHLQLKMTRAGYKTYLWSAKKWETPTEYLRVRARHGWSPWPVYLFGPCLLLGVAALIFGLFRL